MMNDISEIRGLGNLAMPEHISTKFTAQVPVYK
jgi:hypothetical protein